MSRDLARLSPTTSSSGPSFGHKDPWRIAPARLDQRVCASPYTARRAGRAEVDEAVEQQEDFYEEEPAEPAEPAETVSQEQARLSAESYLEWGAFSRKGLIGQLKYEGFSRADATYAVSAISVNWNKQAAKSARSYLDTMPLSRVELIDQLEYEGFTTAQAVYGVNQVGL
jgi:hypothetical protein